MPKQNIVGPNNTCITVARYESYIFHYINFAVLFLPTNPPFFFPCFWLEFVKMGSLSTILRHPDEIYPLLKLKLAIMKAQNQIPLDDPHLAICYSLLQKVSRSFSLVIQQLGTELRDAVRRFIVDFKLYLPN